MSIVYSFMETSNLDTNNRSTSLQIEFKLQFCPLIEFSFKP